MKIALKLVCVMGVTATIMGGNMTAASQEWENRRETTTGSRVSHQAPADPARLASASPVEKARVMMNDFALCHATRGRKKIEQINAKQPVPVLAAQQYDNLLSGTSDCLTNSSLSFNAEIFSGASFLAMLRLDYRQADRVPALHSVDYMKLADVVAPEGRQYVATRSFAQCVVMAAPRETAALLFSRELSKSEDEAFASVSPHLGPCLAAGQEVKFSRTIIYGLLAEAMYRAAKAQPATE